MFFQFTENRMMVDGGYSVTPVKRHASLDKKLANNAVVGAEIPFASPFLEWAKLPGRIIQCQPLRFRLAFVSKKKTQGGLFAFFESLHPVYVLAFHQLIPWKRKSNGSVDRTRIYIA